MKQFLGKFEHLVLLSIGLGNTQARIIQEEISSVRKRKVTPGAIYTTLKRLEQKYYIRHEISSPENRRGGRRKKLFYITKLGQDRLKECVKAIEFLTI